MALEKNHKIIIKLSDKGGGIVVLNQEMYKSMCLKILGDRDGYEILRNNPSPTYKKQQLEELVDWGLSCRIIDKNKQHKFLLPEDPTIATFYSLPKVHKGLTPLKGRPIVSVVGSLTQNTIIYMDKVLREYVISLLFYIQDTTDLLLKL